MWLAPLPPPSRASEFIEHDQGDIRPVSVLPPVSGRGLMAVFPQSGHELRSNEPGAADDDAFHDRCSFCV
jgi:hypothetical protein